MRTHAICSHIGLQRCGRSGSFSQNPPATERPMFIVLNFTDFLSVAPHGQNFNEGRRSTAKDRKDKSFLHLSFFSGLCWGDNGTGCARPIRSTLAACPPFPGKMSRTHSRHSSTQALGQSLALCKHTVHLATFI